MINLIKAAILRLYSILPGSPIKAAFEQTTFDGDFLSYLNWFVPFDNCTTITVAWINCILAYYVFTLVKDLVLDKLISILISAVSK